MTTDSPDLGGFTEQEKASEPNDAVRGILDAALENIAAEKISGSYLRDIASRAGISQGTLHYYFPSKMGLYKAVLEDMSKTFVRQREKSLANPDFTPRQKLGVFFTQMREVILHQREMMLVYYDFWVQASSDAEIAQTISRIYARWRSDIKNVLIQGVESGDFKEENVTFVPEIMVALMEGASLQYMLDTDCLDLDAFFDKACSMVLDLL